MKMKKSSISSSKAAQGLATLALLKVNFDRGHDHIEMFMPFVIDCIGSTEDTFAVEDIRLWVRERHELNLPESVMVTLLGRCSRRGLIRRSAGRWSRVASGPKDDGVDIGAAREQINREHRDVAEALREFAAERGFPIESSDAALSLLLKFIEQYHVALLIDESPSHLFRLNEVLSRQEQCVVARFLERAFDREPLRVQYVARMLEGYVLQNTLLLRDLGLAVRRFQCLFVYLDTGFVLRALGFAGEAHATSSRETLDLLRDTGADCGVFEKTIEEIERILRLYERKLRTPDGILSLRPTDVTRHLVGNRYAPSDVAVAIGNLRRNLGQLGIKIRHFPKREPAFTSNEQALTESLKRTDESDLEPRVTHDVDCVAAILTSRRGERHHSLDTAPAIFATTSASVVRTVRDWYQASGEGGVPPIIHAWALSNAAWLKKPTAATSKKLNELIALCSAALRPTQKAWNAFLRQLKKLQQDGVISTSEEVALAARELVASQLADVDTDGDLDSKTIEEVIERAREEETERTKQAVAQVKSEADRQVSITRDELEKARAARAVLAEESRQIDLHLRGKVRWLARGGAQFVFWSVFLAILVGIILGLPGLFPGRGWARTIGWIAAGLVGALGACNLVWGTTLQDLRLRIESFAARHLTEFMLGERQREAARQHPLPEALDRFRGRDDES